MGHIDTIMNLVKGQTGAPLHFNFVLGVPVVLQSVSNCGWQLHSSRVNLVCYKIGRHEFLLAARRSDGWACRVGLKTTCSSKGVLANQRRVAQVVRLARVGRKVATSAEAREILT